MADIILADISYARQWGSLAKHARIVPLEMNEYQCAAIVQTGKELGLQPLQSLRNMSFINGRITMSVQLQLALARAKGITTPKDWLKEEPGKCTITLKRGEEEVTCEYTLKDAEKAGLARPGGAYTKYERQMLRWRAIGDALRLIAPDIVMGLLSPEEASSITPLQVDDVPAVPVDSVPEQTTAEPFPVQKEAVKEAVPENVPEILPSGGDIKRLVHSEGVKSKVSPAKGIGTDPLMEAIREAKETLEKKSVAPHKTGISGYLDAMKELKARMQKFDPDNKEYYRILGKFGVKHANEVRNMPDMKTVYKTMRSACEDAEMNSGMFGGEQ